MKSKIKKILTIAFFLIVPVFAVAGTKIKGANGQEVEFAAIFDASTYGLVVLISPESTAITIPWAKIDLIDLKAKNLNVFSAYEKALATQKNQPIGLGLAQSMISLSQIKDAMKQAVKEPNYWPYGSGYTYTTTTTGPDGQSTTRNYSTTITRNPNVYISTNTPYLILKRIRDAKGDKEKVEILQKFKSRGYGIEIMLERMDSVVDKLPPEKMFKRESQDITLIRETERFKLKIRDMLEASTLSIDDQSFIGSYLRLLGIN
jgi:hypothetical protein